MSSEGFSVSPDETLLWSAFATRQKSRWRGIGGNLVLTDRHLAFVPHFLERFLRHVPMVWTLDQIDEVSIQRRGSDLPAGIRNRLRIRSGAESEVFLVNHLNDVVDRISTAVTQSR